MMHRIFYFLFLLIFNNVTYIVFMKLSTKICWDCKREKRHGHINKCESKFFDATLMIHRKKHCEFWPKLHTWFSWNCRQKYVRDFFRLRFSPYFYIWKLLWIIDDSLKIRSQCKEALKWTFIVSLFFMLFSNFQCWHLQEVKITILLGIPPNNIKIFAKDVCDAGHDFSSKGFLWLVIWQCERFWISRIICKIKDRRREREKNCYVWSSSRPALVYKTEYWHIKHVRKR